MWEIEYRCEGTFLRLIHELDHEKDAQVRELLEKAGRELLLLQASDWPFVIRRGQAVGLRHQALHPARRRFETLTDLAEKAAGDAGYMKQLTEVEPARDPGCGPATT